MTEIQILTWAIAGGFAGTWALIFYVIKRVDAVEDSLSKKIEKLDEKVTDIDRRLCRLEGAFASKDCCMIKDDRQIRKAE